MSVTLLIKYSIGTDLDFPIPAYQTVGSSGLDIRAYLQRDEREFGITILPGERSLIASGFQIEVPDGFEGQLRARSGLALKYGIGLVNGIGTIDSDYRGDLGVLLINFGSLPFTLNHGERIAQLVILAYERVHLKIVNSVSKTNRSEAGFGSTGNI